MQVLHERCCGLDVHKTKVVACLIIPGKGNKSQKEIRTFGTTTGELNLLSDWLSNAGCTHVAMESTGVYWKRCRVDCRALAPRTAQKQLYPA